MGNITVNFSSRSADFDQKTYWSLLGALRFFLASLVVFSHIYQWFLVENSNYFSEVAKTTGLVAVIAFLVISGYSIASSIARQEKDFCRRRLIRVLPLYILAILFTYSTNFLSSSNILIEQPSLFLIVQNLFLFQGFFCEPVKTNPVVWTLSIEMFFYALAPVLYCSSNRQLIYKIACASAFLFCIYKLLSKYLFPQAPGFHELLFGQGAILLGWAWLLGFYFFFNHGTKEEKISFILPGAIAIGLLYSKNPTGLLIYCLTCFIIIYGGKLKISKQVCLLFSWLGDISYPLYLFHFPILIVLQDFLKPTAAGFYLTAFISSALLDKYYDKPVKAFILKVSASRKGKPS